MITDSGQAPDQRPSINLNQASLPLKNKGVWIYALGIGDRVPEKDLNDVVSRPQNVFRPVTSTNDLPQRRGTVVDTWRTYLRGSNKLCVYFLTMDILGKYIKISHVWDNDFPSASSITWFLLFIWKIIILLWISKKLILTFSFFLRSLGRYRHWFCCRSFRQCDTPNVEILQRPRKENGWPLSRCTKSCEYWNDYFWQHCLRMV